VSATVGFEGLAFETGKSAKSLHSMLSKKGNPSIDHLAAIFRAIRKSHGVDLEAYTFETV
jgi:DNA-binding phage protein